MKSTHCAARSAIQEAATSSTGSSESDAIQHTQRPFWSMFPSCEPCIIPKGLLLLLLLLVAVAAAIIECERLAASAAAIERKQLVLLVLLRLAVASCELVIYSCVAAVSLLLLLLLVAVVCCCYSMRASALYVEPYQAAPTTYTTAVARNALDQESVLSSSTPVK
jgi:hypothetical protein